MTELVLPPGTLSAERRPRLGYAMVIGAATLFAVNGAVSKLALDGSDIGTVRWTELRSTGGFVGLALGLAILAPGRLRIGTRRELGRLAFYGIVGFALVQWLYFVAIDRLPLGIGLLFEFTAPVLIALWARFAWHEPVRRRVWPALALVLVGLGLVAQIWDGLTLDGIGVTAGLLAACALAVFYLMGERLVGRRDPISVTCFGLGFAALAWAVVAPWWSFPTSELSVSVELPHGAGSAPVAALALWGIVLGTIAPFTLSISALKHLPATTVGIVATFEPVAAAVIAWVWLGEALVAVQILGGVVVLVGILLAETSRWGPRRPAEPDTDYPCNMVERVLLASPRGYCAGVERAVETVEKALEHYGAPVYVRKQIVHNIHVVRDLEARGAIFVDGEAEVPRGATIVYSAHGVAPIVHANSANLGHDVIDATCPLVTKVHVQARRYADDGYTVILIGHAGHEEVVGTMGEAPEATVLVQDVSEAEALDLPPDARVAYITQTTLSVDETSEIIAVLRRRFPDVHAPRKEDICYATSNRQWAVKEMLAEIDLLLVLGSKNSSNSNRLVDVARAAGVAGHLIDDETEIDERWLEGVRTVGISSGASAPERLVTRLCDWFRARGVERIEPFQMTTEDVTFKLPVELRRELALAESQR